MCVVHIYICACAYDIYAGTTTLRGYACICVCVCRTNQSGCVCGVNMYFFCVCARGIYVCVDIRIYICARAAQISLDVCVGVHARSVYVSEGILDRLDGLVSLE